MHMTADANLKAVLSLAAKLADADAAGVAIDCLGYKEALAVLFVEQVGGTDPTLDVVWSASALEGSGFANITGAAHKQVLFDNNKVVTSVNLVNNVALVPAAQPANPSRISITITDSTSGITTGTVYLVGTNVRDEAQTELITFGAFSSPTTSVGTKIFKTVTSVTPGVVTGVTGTIDFATLGGGGDETIIAGVDNSGARCAHVGRINLEGVARYVRANPTKGGTNPTGGYFAGLILVPTGLKPVVQVLVSEFSV